MVEYATRDIGGELRSEEKRFGESTGLAVDLVNLVEGESEDDRDFVRWVVKIGGQPEKEA